MAQDTTTKDSPIQDIFPGLSQKDLRQLGIDCRYTWDSWENKEDMPYATVYRIDNKEYYIPIGVDATNRFYVNGSEGGSGKHRVLKLCLLTRNGDGDIREGALRNLVARKDIQQYPEIIPYMIRLVGEYVSQLIDILFEHREIFIESELRKFRDENEQFLSEIMERVISYNNLSGKYKESKAYQFLMWIKML